MKSYCLSASDFVIAAIFPSGLLRWCCIDGVSLFFFVKLLQCSRSFIEINMEGPPSCMHKVITYIANFSYPCHVQSSKGFRWNSHLSMMLTFSSFHMWWPLQLHPFPSQQMTILREYQIRSIPYLKQKSRLMKKTYRGLCIVDNNYKSTSPPASKSTYELQDSLTGLFRGFWTWSADFSSSRSAVLNSAGVS